MKKKLLSVILGLALTAGMMTGCGSSADAPETGAAAPETVETKPVDEPAADDTAAGEKAEITLWHYYTTVNGENFEKMVEEYNSLPDGKANVTVELIPRDELLKKYTLGVVSGDLPDIAMVDNPDAAPLTAMGMFVDVTDRLNAWEGNAFVEGPLASGQYNGGQYTLPFRSNCLALFVNKSHMEAAGLTEIPETWDELMTASEALKKANSNTYPFGFSAVKSEEGVFHYMSLYQSTGATIYDADTENGIKAFRFLADLAEKQYVSPEAINWTQNDVEKQFASGNVSMMINGCWQISNLTADAPDLDYTIAYIPRDKEFATSLGGENMGITKSAEDVEACWDFVTWMLEAENNVPFNVSGTAISPRSDVTPQEQYPDDEKMQIFTEQYEYAKPRGPHEKWSEISSAFQEGIQQTLTGAKSPEEAAKGVAEKVDAIEASLK